MYKTCFWKVVVGSFVILGFFSLLIKMSHDMTKPTKWLCTLCTLRRLRLAWASAQSSLSVWRNLGSLATKTQISLGTRPVWSESLLCAQWVAKDPRFLHTDIEDSNQTGRMPRLIWVFTGCTLTLLVLSCRCSNVTVHKIPVTKPHSLKSK